MSDVDRRDAEQQELERIKALIAALPRDDKGRLLYTLKEPIQFGSETINQLAIRRVKSGDLRSMPEQGRTIGHTLDLIGKVTGQPAAVVNELGREDLGEVSSIVGVF